MVNLHRTFGNEKKATEAEDQITATERVRSMKAHKFYQPLRKKIIDCKQRFLEPNNPGDAEQKSDTHKHGQEKHRIACTLPQLLRQFIGDNGNENDIVDTEYDLQEAEGQ